METHPIRLIDRSRVVAGWTCPRKRYWNYEFNGRGIVKSTTSLPLFVGTVLHDGLAAIATFTQQGQVVPIDTIAEMAFKQLYDGLMESSGDTLEDEAINYANEQATLTEGILRAFYKYTWPILMAQYPKIIAVEQEVEYTLADGFVFMSKPDLLVEDQSGNLVYLEYKSTSSKKPEWINSWDNAVQVHSSIKAVGETLGREPVAVQIVGLFKGYFSYGRQNSPLCYGFKKSGNPPFTQDAWSYEYKAGWKRVPTWEMSGGVKQWIEDMPDEILVNQFPLTPQIFVNNDLVDSFFKQTLTREQDIAGAMQKIYDNPMNEPAILDEFFSQRFDQCQPAYGFNCEYKKLCHGSVQDPLTEGFVYRDGHHKREADMYVQD